MTTYINEGYTGGNPVVDGQTPIPAGCPPGLEYLAQIDQVLVHQAVELLEAFTGIETNNKFAVKNSMGQQIFYAAEESGFCTKQCCGSRRGFVMHVANNMGNEVMRVNRDFKCCAGCCWCAFSDCCSYEVAVEAPIGTPIGYIVQSCSFWKPHFEVLDEHYEPILNMHGPCCIFDCCCCEPEFVVETPAGKKVGCITKQWTGLVKEVFTQADNFGVQFPMDMDAKTKATLIGGVFLIVSSRFAFYRNSIYQKKLPN